MSDSLWPRGLYSPWNSPGHNTGVGSHSFLQGIFPTQELNPGLAHCRWILYQPSHQGSPRTLEWVAYPFSSGFSRPRNWTEVSCSASGFFTCRATREVHINQLCFCFFFFNFIFKLYIIVLVLPNIKMNPLQVYMCSPSWTLLPPPSPYHPSVLLFFKERKEKKKKALWCCDTWTEV